MPSDIDHSNNQQSRDTGASESDTQTGQQETVATGDQQSTGEPSDDPRVGPGVVWGVRRRDTPASPTRAQEKDPRLSNGVEWAIAHRIDRAQKRGGPRK